MCFLGEYYLIPYSCVSPQQIICVCDSTSVSVFWKTQLTCFLGSSGDLYTMPLCYIIPFLQKYLSFVLLSSLEATCGQVCVLLHNAKYNLPFL